MPDARAGNAWADVAVVLDGAVLAAMPGPALLVSPQGTVRAANGPATPIAAALTAGEEPNMLEMIAIAASTGHAARDVMRLTVPEGVIYAEMTALPTGDPGQLLLVGRDITLETNLRSALVDSRQRYKTLVDISSDFAWEVGADGRFCFVSPKGALGFAADQLIGVDPRDLLVSGMRAEHDNPFATHYAIDTTRVWLRSAKGAPTCLITTATPQFDDEDGRWTGARGVCRDVTAEHEREMALARARNRERVLTAIVQTFRERLEPTDMLDTAAKTLVDGLGADGCQLFRAPRDADGRTRIEAMQLAAAAGSAGTLAEARKLLGNVGGGAILEVVQGEWMVLATAARHKKEVNGAVILWRRRDGLPWSDDDRILINDLAGQIGIVNEQAAAHERIVELSRTDGLTGLFNRRAFLEELQRRFSRLSQAHEQAALMYVDLDNFKAVNDVHGHKTGDEVLVKVRDMLVKHSRPTDLVARLGGDEFALWLEGASEDVAIERATALLRDGDGLNDYSGRPDQPLHFSIGLAFHDRETEETFDDLIHRADLAMYSAKKRGKADYQIAPPPTAMDAATKPGKDETRA